MSAPLVVNTRDGACWTRRTVTAGGVALYALADVCSCPEFVMATLAELAERGIIGSADALPMPVGPEPVPVAEPELDAALGEIAAFLRVRLALESARRGRRELRARVAELEYVAPSPSCTRCYGADAERFVAQGGAAAACPVCGPSELEELRAQVTDLEAARDQLVRWHGEDAKTITTLVARVDRYRAELTALRNDALSMRGSLAPADGDRKVPFELGETLTPAVDWLIARVAELEAAQGTVYRASHDSIVMGLYRTAAEARKHCETEMRREYDETTKVSLWWREDEDTADQPEDGEQELFVHATPAGMDRGRTWAPGYVVTPLEIAAEYDAEADQ